MFIVLKLVEIVSFAAAGAFAYHLGRLTMKRDIMTELARWGRNRRTVRDYLNFKERSGW